MVKCINAKCGADGPQIVLARVPDDPVLYHCRCIVCDQEWVE